MEKLLPVVDRDACTGCVACVDACDRGCLLMVDGVAVLIDAEACAGSEHCVESCPIGAIRRESVAL
jgi:MinD superfamily P-loop ATPase